MNEAHPKGARDDHVQSARGPVRVPLDLEGEYRRIQESHRAGVKSTVVRMSLPGSIVRVFQKGTKVDLVRYLTSIPVDELLKLRGEHEFRDWYQTQLDKVADAIAVRNPPGGSSRIYPGMKWGHAAKVLAVYLHNLVAYSRYFSDAEAREIEPLLTCPVDGLVLARLRFVGERLPATSIRMIATQQDHWAIQDRLQTVAAKVGVPRIWFDDNWGYRQEPVEVEDLR